MVFYGVSVATDRIASVTQIIRASCRANVLNGLDVWEDDGLGCCCGLIGFEHAFKDALNEASGTVVLVEFGNGSESAESWVEDDFFDQMGFLLCSGSACLCSFAGQVHAGGLQAVEEEAGSLGVDLIAGDAAEDFADGGLDGAAVFGQWQVKLGLATVAASYVLDGAAGGVVVVAEVLVTEAGTAAAATVGEDMAALIAFGFGVHFVLSFKAMAAKTKDLKYPPGVLQVLKSSKIMS